MRPTQRTTFSARDREEPPPPLIRHIRLQTNTRKLLSSVQQIIGGESQEFLQLPFCDELVKKPRRRPNVRHLLKSCQFGSEALLETVLREMPSIVERCIEVQPLPQLCSADFSSRCILHQIVE